MRKGVRVLDIASMKHEEFLVFFGSVITGLAQSREKLTEICENLTLLNKEFWGLEMVDPANSARKSTFLHSIVCFIIFKSPSEEVRFKLLHSVMWSAPFALWDVVLASAESESEGVNQVFRLSPRECLFRLCVDDGREIYLSLLSDLLDKLPHESWKNDVSRYLAVFKRIILREKGVVKLDVSSLLLLIANNRFNDFRLWSQSEFSDQVSDQSQQGPLLSLIIQDLISKIKKLESSLENAHRAQSVQDYTVSKECLILRKGITSLLEILYVVARSAPAAIWEGRARGVASLLNELIELSIVGSGYPILVDLVQYVVSVSSLTIRESVSSETLEKIRKIQSLCLIEDMLVSKEPQPLSLVDDFELFCEQKSEGSILIVRVVTVSSLLARFKNARTSADVLRLARSFTVISGDVWCEKMRDPSLDSALNGESVLYVCLSLLKQKLSEDDHLLVALNLLMRNIPASSWVQGNRSAKTSAATINNAHSPYRIIWNLCEQENGDVFLPVLSKILAGFSKAVLQSEMGALIDLVFQFLLRKKEAITTPLAEFILFLIQAFGDSNDVWFRSVMAHLPEKRNRLKSVGEFSHASCIVGALCDALGFLLSNAERNDQLIELVISSLRLIVLRSSPEAWEPLIQTVTPLNSLVQLVLLSSGHAEINKIFTHLLVKLSQDSLKAISSDDVKKLLLLPAFADHKKLIQILARKQLVAKQPVAVKKAAPKQSDLKKTTEKKLPNARVSNLKQAEKCCSPASLVSKKTDEVVLPPPILECVQSDNATDLFVQEDKDGGYGVPDLLPPPSSLRWANDNLHQHNRPRETIGFFRMPLDKAAQFAAMGKLGDAMWGPYVENYSK